jgi:hypothetical protein
LTSSVTTGVLESPVESAGNAPAQLYLAVPGDACNVSIGVAKSAASGGFTMVAYDDTNTIIPGASCNTTGTAACTIDFLDETLIRGKVIRLDIQGTSTLGLLTITPSMNTVGLTTTTNITGNFRSGQPLTSNFGIYPFGSGTGSSTISMSLVPSNCSGSYNYQRAYPDGTKSTMATGVCTSAFGSAEVGKKGFHVFAASPQGANPSNQWRLTLGAAP